MNAVPACRVVVTGVGAVSAFGVGAETLWQGLRSGESGIAPLRLDDADRTSVRVAAQIPSTFLPEDYFDAKSLPLLDPISQLTLVAAREAVAQSGLDAASLGTRVGAIVGTGVGGICTHDEQSRRLYEGRSPRMHPLTIVRTMMNAPASQVSMEFGVRGPVFAVSSACASSNHAIAQAMLLIRSGAVDAVIVGGADACMTLGMLKGWEAMRILSSDTCRPFSAGRKGLVLGEGAAVFVLESLEHATRRGANVLAGLAGVGMSADAGEIVAPSAEGAAAAIEAALADAGWSADHVDYVNAHGTGTLANDATETRALHIALGARARDIPISSTKSMHGHALGAAGALELVAVLGALRDQFVPPTANFLEADPDCDLDYVPNVGRPARLRCALSNAFAFGGLNAVLAIAQA